MASSSSSSSAPSEQEASESIMEKFGHLLKPLRNLADDWEIDVAHDLEEYLDELSHLQITIDGRNCNFAEAALLIQGSTFHYSRKVESLLKLVYAALNAISAKKRRIMVSSSSSSSKGGSFDMDADMHFLELDWPTAAPNIDLKESKLAMRRMSTMSARSNGTRRTSSVDPNMSIASVDSMASMRSTATAGGGRRRLSILNLLSHSSAKDRTGSGDRAGGSSGGGGSNVQFRLSSCGMDKSGALLLDKSACFNRNEPVDLSMSRLSRTHAGLAAGSHVDAADFGVNDDDAAAGAAGGNGGTDMSDFGAGDDDYGDDYDPEPQHQHQQHQQHQQDPRSLSLAAQMAQELMEAADPLAPLDPHADSSAAAGAAGSSGGRTTTTKAFRKGKPFVVPRSLRAARRRTGRPDKDAIVAQWLESVTERSSTTAVAAPSSLAAATRRPFGAIDEEEDDDPDNDDRDSGDDVDAASAAGSNPTMTFPAVQAIVGMASGNARRARAAPSMTMAASMMPVCAEFRPLRREQVREERRQQKLQDMAARFSSAYGMAGGRASAASYNAAADFMQAQQVRAGAEYFSDDDMDDDFGGGDMDYGDDASFGGGGGAATDADFDFRPGVGGAAAGAGGRGVFGSGGADDVDAHQIVDGVDFSDGAGSYEGLVKEIEERWHRAGKEYERTSRLAERVSAWEDRLRPIFAENATHPPFDIDRYGEDILRTYVENLDADAEEVVSLAELAAGKPQYDVCRIFLASLQLANTGNIDIERGGEGDREEQVGDDVTDEDVRVLGLDQLRFRLRSTERTNFMEYRAPSAAAAAAGAAGVAADNKTKRAFGKNIAPNVANAE